MFWRAEKDNVTEPDLTVAYNGSAPRNLELASRDFFDAHAAIVALGEACPDLPASDETPPASALPSLRCARDRALLAVRQYPARDRSDIQTKMRVFFALEDWFGCEESSVAEFSAELLHETCSLLAADQLEMPSAKFGRRSSRPIRPTWLDRFPRFPRLAQTQSPLEPRSVRRSQD